MTTHKSGSLFRQTMRLISGADDARSNDVPREDPTSRRLSGKRPIPKDEGRPYSEPPYGQEDAFHGEDDATAITDAAASDGAGPSNEQPRLGDDGYLADAE